ncbi:MAG: hypothetical protein CSB48_13775 [Proteobacteria bacterium]|nr:MAG: hypothetical protein CSB48_13775 [Pseudomonadota bacterium]
MKPLLHHSSLKTLYPLFVTAGSALLIACSDGSSDPAKTDQGKPDTEQSIKLVPGQSADYLESYLKGALRHNTSNPFYRTPGLEEKADIDMNAPDSGDTGAATGGGFTNTNTQVLGVDESDLVKYDGQYIYIAVNRQRFYTYDRAEIGLAGSDSAPAEPTPERSARIRIMETTRGDTPGAIEIATIEPSEKAGYITGMYLHNSQLAVLGNSDNFGWNSWYRYDFWSNSKTYLSLMDVDDPTNVSTTWSIEIEGSLIDSRRIDNTLYLVTRYVPDLPIIHWYPENSKQVEENNQAIAALTLEDLLPETASPNGNTANLVSGENCYVPESAVEDYYSPALITLSAIDLASPGTITSVCIAGNSSGIFASKDSLYLFNDQWDRGTIVHKFSFTDQGTAYKGSGTVPGSLGWRAPSFRLTEKDNALVVVSTVLPNAGFGFTEPDLVEDAPVSREEKPRPEPATVPVHTLTVLTEGGNNELVTAATLPNENRPTVIGKPNEDIYAVRYTGDRGYIVTYQKTDPLYVVDLRDVKNPVISGELHVEGYSDYLHPIGEQYLIGVGKSSEVLENIAWYQGVQVGLFDVADLASPQLIKQIEIGDRGSDTEVSRNHKAFSFLALDDTNYRMAIPIRVHQGPQKHPSNWTDWAYDGLHLFDINLEGGNSSLEKAGTVIASRPSGSESYGPVVETRRSIIHGDAVHYVYGKAVISANWNDPKGTNTGPR